MAIIWDEKTQSHTIRRGGALIDTLTPERFVSALDDRALEADIKAALENKAAASNRTCVALVHIFSRDPLRYVLRVAPTGHKPRTDWWVAPESRSRVSQ